VSRWHRIDAAEIWHWYAGAPLQLVVAADGKDATHHTLGPNLHDSERPQAVAPANHWQQARSTGEWTLVGCTVEAFELARVGSARLRAESCVGVPQSQIAAEGSLSTTVRSWRDGATS
jgi:predicted cupin superfamily sugar epimerase